MKKADRKGQLQKIKKYSLSSVGISLFSHLVAKALFSAPLSLTSVFGMGTGGPSASSTPTADSEYSFGSPNWARTSDIMINSHALYRLSYGGSYKFSQISLRISSKIQSNVKYLNIRSHYRLSYGGMYKIPTFLKEFLCNFHNFTL